eukprot:scaffold7328_cov314-Pinguiococcus_pyrenoidosus.AAC.10
MGVLDAASSTLGALGGAGTPGQLQTLINQSVIPITILISWLQLGRSFKRHQLVGAVMIVSGCVVGAMGIFKGDDQAGATSAVSATAIALFVVSVIPGAFSNVYKETHMKEEDLNVYVTTTMVSIWQELLGFLFLPLMMLQPFGGLSFLEMQNQMSGGFQCFLGTNPAPNPGFECEGSGYVFALYVIVNFLYNITLLLITKRGSAVLLVVSNALALPVTNVAFTLEIFMGDDAESFTLEDLAGLILVVVGFLTYSAFGLAHKFLVAQGPPGQMTYTPIEQNFDLELASMDPRSASARALTSPDRLARFLATIATSVVDDPDQAIAPVTLLIEGVDRNALEREVQVVLQAKELADRASRLLEAHLKQIEDYVSSGRLDREAANSGSEKGRVLSLEADQLAFQLPRKAPSLWSDPEMQDGEAPVFPEGSRYRGSRERQFDR